MLRSDVPDVSVGGEPPDDLPAPSGVAFGVGSRWAYVSPFAGPNDSAVEALSAGASAVLNLGSDVENLHHAVQAVIAGRDYIPVDLVRWMATRATTRNNADTGEDASVHLTAREREVLYLLAHGLSNTEISRELTISINTVRTHIHTLGMKLEAPSRARIVANARTAGIPEALNLDADPRLDDRSQEIA